MRIFLTLYIILGLAVIPAYSQADQNDIHLDALFDLLYMTDNNYQGAEITRQIWIRWQGSEDEEVKALMDTGIGYMTDSNYDQALLIFTEITKIAPKFAEGWNKRATVLYMMGDLKSSTDDVDKTLALEPRHFGAIAGQGYIYLKEGNKFSAISEFKKALQLNPFLIDLKNHIRALEKSLRKSIV